MPATARKSRQQQDTYLDFDLPLHGVFKGSAWHRLPEGYSFDMNNCLPVDSLGRARLGSRPGTSKFFGTTQFGTGTSRFVQHLSQVTAQVGGGTLHYVIIVCGGRTYRMKPSDTSAQAVDGGSALFSAGRRVEACTFANKTYFTDGQHKKVLDHAAGTMSDWNASAGTFPTAGGEYPRYIVTWRGRIVLSHLDSGNPGTIFMTAMSDPTDFNYGTTFTPITAIATDSNYKVGQLGDPVSALIPISDDVLIVGTDTGIYRFVGDPASAGQFLPLTTSIGMLNQDAWCMDGNRNVYFVASGGLYQMIQGGSPEKLLNGAFDSAFAALPQVGYYVECEFDSERQGIWIFITQVGTPYATRHLFYSIKPGTEGFYPLSFPSDSGGDDGTNANTLAPTHGPSKAVYFDGYDSTTSVRGMLIGCRDGYVRLIDSTVMNDDGAAISSYVWLPPIQPAGVADEAMLNGLYVVMGEATNFNCDLTVYGGNDPQSAFVSSAAITHSGISSGRQSPLGDRLTANSFLIKCANSTISKRFDLERITGRFGAAGPVR